MILLQILGFFVPAVFSKKYATPSGSHFGALPGFQKCKIAMMPVWSVLLRKHLGILSIQGDLHLRNFFSPISSSSVLISFQYCWSLSLFTSGVCSIHSDTSLNSFLPPHICFWNFQHLQ